MRDAKALKDVLRLLREERGFSQTQVAEGLGVDPSAISAWEAGQRKPGFDRMFQLADLLGLDLGDLDRGLGLVGGAPPRRRRRAASADTTDTEELVRILLGTARSPLPVSASEAALAKVVEALVELAAAVRRERSGR